MKQSTETNNGKYICLYAEDAVGNKSTLASANVINIDANVISYDGNGNDSGTVPDSQTKTQGVDLTLRSNTGNLAKTGYTFSGWNTAADGSGTHYAEAGTFSTEVDTTLYAEWTIYFINFVSPTPSDNATISPDQNAEIKVSSDSGEHEVVMNWNNSLVDWWTFGSGEAGDLTDYSGNNNTLTNNNATYTDSGKFGGAYSFNGTSSYLVAPNNVDLSSGGTFSAWVYPNSYSNNPRIINNANSGLDFLVYSGEINQFMLIIGSDWIYSGDEIPTSQWVHVVATVDSTGTHMYVNGESVYSDATARSVGTVKPRIGWGGAPDLDYWNGDIDDVQIYNRALSSAEIKSLYNAQSNQYDNTFSNLAVGSYTYQAYSQDLAGSILATGQQTLNVATLSTYTVTYNGNDNISGTAPSSQTKTQGVDLTLRSNTGTLAKTGYTFSGWNTAADGSGTHYAEAGTFSTEADTTLYAEWTATQTDNNSNGGIIIHGYILKQMFDNARIEQLKAQIAALQAQIAVLTKTAPLQNQTSGVYKFTRDLYFGISGKDVKELQKYLNIHGFVLAEEGYGSMGNETEMFGKLTKQALIKFQEAKGIELSWGFFGPITREFVNNSQ